MARPQIEQQGWTRMVRDTPRNQLPRDAAWNLQDYIPQMIGAPLSKRGGWSYASPALSAVASSATYCAGLAHAPFSGGAQLVAFTDNSKSVKITNPSTQSQISATSNIPLQTAFFRDSLIIPDNDGSTAPRTYDGSSEAALGGSPPAGKYICAYKERIYLASSTANKERVWASGAENAAVWDTTAGWFDALTGVTGLASLPNAMLVFQSEQAMRVRGSNPPPGGDFVYDDPIFNVGCTDARSIAVVGPHCFFANPLGVYMSQGTNQPENLTKTCGIHELWTASMSSYASSSWSLAGGVYRHLYWITIMNGSSFVDSFVFDYTNRAAWRNTNLKASCFAQDLVGAEQGYFGLRSADRVASMSSMFSPASGVKNDADGTAVTGVVETPFFDDQSSGKKRWKSAYVRYKCLDAATDNPVLTLSYTDSPTATDTYTALSPTMAETSGSTLEYTSVKIPIRLLKEGLGFKITQTNASSVTELQSFLLDGHSREAGRV